MFDNPLDFFPVFTQIYRLISELFIRFSVFCFYLIFIDLVVLSIFTRQLHANLETTQIISPNLVRDRP